MSAPSGMCFQCRLNIGAARSDLGRFARQLADNDLPQLRSRLKLARAHLERQKTYAVTCPRCAAERAAQAEPEAS